MHLRVAYIHICSVLEQPWQGWEGGWGPRAVRHRVVRQVQPLRRGYERLQGGLNFGEIDGINELRTRTQA